MTSGQKHKFRLKTWQENTATPWSESNEYARKYAPSINGNHMSGFVLILPRQIIPANLRRLSYEITRQTNKQPDPHPP